MHNVPQCVHFIPDKPQLVLGKDRGFTFDYVFPPKTTQVFYLKVINNFAMLINYYSIIMHHGHFFEMPAFDLIFFCCWPDSSTIKQSVMYHMQCIQERAMHTVLHLMCYQILILLHTQISGGNLR